MRIAGVVFFALLVGCGQAPLPCDGPKQCGGNACCFNYQYTYGPGSVSTSVACAGSPADCVPTITTTDYVTRLCQTDADCVAGGISTSFPVCCPASVIDHYARSCQSYCNRTQR